ncbi:MAG: phosphatidate cytidylyltransferase [Solirubrobacterales bacterium]|nr:phosphatidate cytidylyltransferase [Solirubrobacterales bacterium]
MDFPPRPGSSRPRRESPQGESPFSFPPEPEPEAETGESAPVPAPGTEAEPEPAARSGGRRFRRRAANKSGGGRRSETIARVLWAIPWIVFAVFIVAVGGPVFAVAAVGLAWAVQIELFRMTARSRPFEAAAFAGTAGMVAAAYFGSSFQILLALVATVPVMLVFALARPSLKNVTWSLAMTMLALVWIGLPFAHAVLLRELPLHGGALLVDVLVATFFTDTFAYLGGRLFGQRSLAPQVSPNKTIEGLLIGIVGGVLGFWLAGLYQDWLSGPQALLFGFCIAILAPLGDLFESAIKRDLDVKDTGRMLGPHGGLLDRLDAVLFTIVAGYYLALAIVY